MPATLLLILATFAPAQDAPSTDESRLKAAHDQAVICGKATVEGDYETLLDMTHESLHKVAGGREKLAKILEQGIAQLKADGYTITGMTADPPKNIRRSSRAMYCVVPKTVVIKADASKVTVKGYLLAISADDGKTWKFLDGAEGEAATRKLLPDVPKDLEFPAESPFKFEKAD